MMHMWDSCSRHTCPPRPCLDLPICPFIALTTSQLSHSASGPAPLLCSAALPLLSRTAAAILTDLPPLHSTPPHHPPLRCGDCCALLGCAVRCDDEDDDDDHQHTGACHCQLRCFSLYRLPSPPPLAVAEASSPSGSHRLASPIVCACPNALPHPPAARALWSCAVVRRLSPPPSAMSAPTTHRKKILLKVIILGDSKSLQPSTAHLPTTLACLSAPSSSSRSSPLSLCLCMWCGPCAVCAVWARRV